MIQITPSDLDPRDAYRLLISVVIPRPIAWVSTLRLDGGLNLAPYSFFNAVSGNPPSVMISIGERRTAAGREAKDTLRNARDTGEFVVNLVDETLAEAMNLTSGEYAYEVDEFEKAGLHPAPSSVVRPPRVAEARAALECQVTLIVPVPESHNTLVLGRVVRFHLQEGLLRPNGTADSARLNALGRLGGDEYARMGEVFTMKRPSV